MATTSENMACTIHAHRKGSRWLKLGLLIAENDQACLERKRGKSWATLIMEGLVCEESYWLWDEEADRLAFGLRRALHHSGVLYDPKQVR